MCRILDKAENFEFIYWVYLLGYSTDGQADIFWKKYDKARFVFLYPFKLSNSNIFQHHGYQKFKF